MFPLPRGLLKPTLEWWPHDGQFLGHRELVTGTGSLFPPANGINTIPQLILAKSTRPETK